MKKAVGILLFLALMIFHQNTAQASLFDPETHNKWRKQKLQEILDALKTSEKTGYLIPFIKEYDKNGDEFIDRKESEEIKKYLIQNPNPPEPAKPPQSPPAAAKPE